VQRRNSQLEELKIYLTGHGIAIGNFEKEYHGKSFRAIRLKRLQIDAGFINEWY